MPTFPMDKIVDTPDPLQVLLLRYDGLNRKGWDSHKVIRWYRGIWITRLNPLLYEVVRS